MSVQCCIFLEMIDFFGGQSSTISDVDQTLDKHFLKMTTNAYLGQKVIHTVLVETGDEEVGEAVMTPDVVEQAPQCHGRHQKALLEGQQGPAADDAGVTHHLRVP